jgi:hypothetical protein
MTDAGHAARIPRSDVILARFLAVFWTYFAVLEILCGADSIGAHGEPIFQEILGR